jgi:hypothetical protein
MQPAVGDLIDAELPRPRRVPLTHREQEQGWRRRSGHVDREDSAPATVGLRDVELGAAAEPRAIAGFGVTWAQSTDRHAVRRQMRNRALDRLPRSLGGVAEVLREDLLVDAEIEAQASCPVGDFYPSPSGGCISGPCSCQNLSDSSEVIALVPVRLRTSSIEVALEGQSGA